MSSPTLLEAVKRELIPLNFNNLLSAAISRTGLKYSNDQQCEESLKVIIDSCNNEADLSLIRRIAPRDHLLELLETRFRLIDQWQQTPEILEQKIHYDVSLSASQEPTPKETQIILQLFKSAFRPILIHCQAGADRSGLVAATRKVIVDNKSKIEASKDLSILYGHSSLGPASAIDHFFEKWRPELTVVEQ
ncbi:MAG: hypothetical protein ACLP29_16245 [Dissulfurispiraceae bacterium]